MSRATPEMRDFAERLVAYETAKTKSGTDIPAAFFICEKLRPQLALLMGCTGFSALLSRALALALREAPGLRAVRVNADGTLAGMDAPEARMEPEDLAAGGVALLAQLLGLLEGFIGGTQTLRIMGEVWPKLNLSELYFRHDHQE